MAEPYRTETSEEVVRMATAAPKRPCEAADDSAGRRDEWQAKLAAIPHALSSCREGGGSWWGAAW